jgi:hypothetical protein
VSLQAAATTATRNKKEQIFMVDTGRLYGMKRICLLLMPCCHANESFYSVWSKAWCCWWCVDDVFRNHPKESWVYMLFS